MDVASDAALSHSEHPPSPPPRFWALWLAVRGSATERERGWETRIRQRKNSIAYRSSSSLSLSLSLTLSVIIISIPRSPSLLLLLLARPWCSLVPEDIQWFNTMDLLTTDCCLQRGIMGAGVCSAVQECSWSAGDCGSSELRDVSWWADEARQTLSFSILPHSLFFLTSLLLCSVLEVFWSPHCRFPHHPIHFIFQHSYLRFPARGGGVRMGCRLTRTKVSDLQVCFWAAERERGRHRMRDGDD